VPSSRGENCSLREARARRLRSPGPESRCSGERARTDRIRPPRQRATP
jgi:hypothetical protein